MEARSTDTRLKPGYYGQFRLSRLIRTPVNMDNGHFSVTRVTNSHTSSTPLYGHWLDVVYISTLSIFFIFIVTIGHFRVAVNLIMKARLGAQLFI